MLEAVGPAPTETANRDLKAMKKNSPKDTAPIVVRVGHRPFRTGSAGPVWTFWCEEFASVSGTSREPLLDACRMILDVTTGPDRKRRANLIDDKTGRVRLTGIVSKAARLTVSEPNKGTIKFVKWAPNPFYPRQQQ
jgi:hypothetical protein